MNFFKTAFFEAEDASPVQTTENADEEASPLKNEENADQDATDGWENDEDSAAEETSGGIWNFGGLVKVLTSKSEEVIEAYRRDLDEFRTGLKKETEAIREVASRAVKDLPNSLEAGASVAQESLESVGQVIDEFGSTVWRGTTDILAEGKDLISKLDEDKENSSNDQVESSSSSSVYSNVGVQKYSRFEAQIRAMQLDSNTYCREPEDAEDFEAWKAGFRLEEKAEEVEVLCRENVFMEEVKFRLVPKIVDYETFWTRYFYRLHKLKQAEEARADLVKRAIISPDDEDLSWEVDDDDDEIELKEDIGMNNLKIGKDLGAKPEINEEAGENSVQLSQSDQNLVAKQEIAEETGKKPDIAGQMEKKPEIAQKAEPALEHVEEMTEEAESSEIVVEKPRDDEILGQKLNTKEGNGESPKVDDESGDPTFLEVKTYPAESSKSSEFSVVSSKPSSSHDEEDLGWDEIEDLSCVDEKKLAAGGSPHRADIRKRINAIEDDEDLSWDVDDDDIKP
ncbi:hypothetical protein SUGI_0143830 [Cryptomeria japonica]|uniref:uncharacterized protein LOC131075343 n=1 Tax=Cryptomeria japonica TaxID=3369 RepID=UPI002408ED3C|nr:uncharacterized protein LOC131075343 [Cryptomeria japonica]GLJ11125.1 hypothetical protein SUGI_0143830 [Cryptomeria japonica]